MDESVPLLSSKRGLGFSLIGESINQSSMEGSNGNGWINRSPDSTTKNSVFTP